ncbi:MAG: hypothetical protein WC773_00590 [Patescibacteria group bacterium]|jgi:hypothetical protein
MKHKLSHYLPKAKSSALILTLVIVTLIASMIFFIGRSAIKEQKTAASSNSSLGAYYAAEAGIETGLAMLASDKNLESPTCLTGAVDCTLSNLNSNLSVDDLAKAVPESFPERVRLARFGANGALSNNATDTDLGTSVSPLLNGVLTMPDPTEYVYDLKITSKIDTMGKVSGANPPQPMSPCSASPCATTDPGFLANGNVKEFTLETGVGADVPGNINIFWTCTDRDCDGRDQILIEYIRNNCGGNTECTEDRVMGSEYANHSTPLVGFGTSNATGNITKIRIKPVSSDVATFSGINFSLVAYNKTNDGTVPIKSDITKVQSIGYYGGIKRRLEANVDRSSGALLGLFDYAVYAGGTLTQP